jgi:phosphoribosyl 1,2-cyclic phosphodiesterase
MIRYAVLGSGSSGNSYLIGFQEESVLFDAGFSLKQMQCRAEEAQFDFSKVGALCITHLHPDHCRGAGVFARKTGKPVFVHRALVEGSLKELVSLRIPSDQLKVFSHNEPFVVGAFTITAFPTSHDSPSSMWFSVGIRNRQFAIITDTGKIDDTMKQHALDSDVLFLEANYDELMLHEGPYPYMLKQRIQGVTGHLSNRDAIQLLNTCTTDRLTDVYFCHLSKVNNRPEILAEHCEQHLTWKGKHTICEHGQLYCGSVDPGEII